MSKSHYRAGRFSEAREQARQAGQSPSLESKQAAAYLAGLCSYRLHEADAAERELLPALNGPNTAVRGKSSALLGIIRLQQDRPAEAAPLLRQAAVSLSGWDGTQARRFAARARELSVAHVYSPDRPAENERSPVPFKHIGPGGFTIQLGAFREKRRADETAATARAIARSHDLHPVRIVTRPDLRGRMLYLVQLGRFNSRAAAAVARREIGKPESIISRGAR